MTVRGKGLACSVIVVMSAILTWSASGTSCPPEAAPVSFVLPVWHARAARACAARALGLADVIHLGYRDSGMPGAPDNTHPNALAAAPVEAVAARIVKVLREVKPQVVIGNDPIGGSRHPDTHA